VSLEPNETIILSFYITNVKDNYFVSYYQIIVEVGQNAHNYLIYSSKLDRYYIVHTSDMKGRLRRHNTSHKGFTGKSNDWEVVYTEKFSTKIEAYSREMEIKKKKSRKYIENLIRSAGFLLRFAAADRQSIPISIGRVTSSNLAMGFNEVIGDPLFTDDT
ncbi:MAG: GIY-YIG nuclease family protein, partial [Bacteroidota bacterium]